MRKLNKAKFSKPRWLVGPARWKRIDNSAGDPSETCELSSVLEIIEGRHDRPFAQGGVAFNELDGFRRGKTLKEKQDIAGQIWEKPNQRQSPKVRIRFLSGSNRFRSDLPLFRAKLFRASGVILIPWKTTLFVRVVRGPNTFRGRKRNTPEQWIGSVMVRLPAEGRKLVLFFVAIEHERTASTIDGVQPLPRQITP
jgi:hypothetical protein